MRILAVLALSASLAAAGCTGPDGQIDPGPTIALTAGLAALGGLAYIASQDNHRPRYGHGYRSSNHQGWGGGRGRGRGWR